MSRLLLLLVTLVAVTRASGYAVLEGEDTFPLKWFDPTVTMVIKVDNVTKLADNNTRATSIQMAMTDPTRGWNRYLGTVQFVAQISAAGSGSDGDQTNQIFFADTPYDYGWDSNTLAVTTAWGGGDHRGEADIIFNTAYSWDSYRGTQRFNGTNPVVDIQRVALHELGHVLGLDHPDEAGQSVTAIMNSVISNIDSLQSDDIAGAQSLYGAPGVHPANDSFANAISIPGAVVSTTFNGSNVGATKESGEPAHAGNAGAHSVWWSWTAPSSGNVNLDTIGSNFDTLLAVYTGTTVAGLTAIASNDDIQDGVIQNSALAFTCTSGVTYHFAVDGWGGDEGSIVLTLAFSVLAPPSFTGQPTSQSVGVGATATFTVAANGFPMPTFQWQRLAAGSGTWANLTDSAGYSGSSLATLSVVSANSMNGDQFRCVATNSQGSATSSPATLTVTKPADAISYDSTNFPATAVQGGTINFTYSVTNQGSQAWGPNHYLVLRDASQNNLQFFSTNGVAPGGSITASFSLTVPSSPGSYVYYVQALENNVEWFPNVASLNLSVLDSTVSFTTRPLSRIVIAGQPLNATATATGAGPVSYVWKHNRRVIAGATQATLSIPSMLRGDSGYYEVIASDSSSSAESIFYVSVAPVHGGIVAWGANESGQINVPTILSNVREVAAGDSVSLAVKSDGTVAQWGAFVSDSDVPPADLGNVVAVDAGEYHALALKSDGTVVAWGYTGWGAVNVPAGLSNVVAVAAGDTFSLALKSDGTVVEWGMVGNSNPAAPVPAGLDHVVAIAAARFDCLALKSDGTIVNWGGSRTVPAGLTDVTAVAAGWYNAVTLSGNGNVLQWGDLDINPATAITGAIAVTTSYVDTSNGSSLALMPDGSLITWGYGGPNLPAGLDSVYQIATGGSFSLALRGIDDVGPLFAIQPSPQVLTHPGLATFTVAAVGTPAPTYQWQRLAAGSSNWISLGEGSGYSGTNAATLTVLVATASMNGDQFRCVVTNPLGSVISNPAMLSVTGSIVSDLNGDTKPDLLWENTAGIDRAIWYMNGASIAGFDYLAGIDAEWKIVGTGDFDGDGQTDIAWENTTTGDRTCWFMNGKTIANFGYFALVDTAWHIAAIGDFDGDGKPDLVWENNTTGDRAVWFLNGQAIASFGYIAGIDPAWHIVGAADFDGDGQTDLVWENLVTGDRTIWYMNGATLSSFGYIGNVPGAWHIAMVADMDGDGHPDLVWENRTTGDRAIWLMNDASLLSSPYLAFVDPAWHIAP